MQDIKRIRLPLPYRLGSVNCYLVETGTGHVLIDTGGSNMRADLEQALLDAGCTPGHLDLIVLTHGDFDHTGNAAYLRRTFGAQAAMHDADAGMAERGDMFLGRKRPNLLIRWLVPVLFRFGKSERFTPDVAVEDGTDLSAYGLDATVLSLPGHSKGSIGILTAAGDLFCGDLFDNTDKPVLNDLIDDRAAANASVARLKRLAIRTVYPGHGEPFSMERFVNHE